MSSPIWMPLYVGKYLGKTGHLSTLEHGAYMLLTMHYWQEGSLPDDDIVLSEVCRMSIEAWQNIRPKMARFFHVRKGKSWKHDTIEEELDKAKKLIEKKRNAGLASANARSTPVEHLSNQLQPQLPIQNQERKTLLNGFVVGKKRAGNGGVTILDPNKRLAIFQKTLANSFRENGWDVVCAAADPSSSGHAIALETCKTQARLIGKGWPKQWPGTA